LVKSCGRETESGGGGFHIYSQYALVYNDIIKYTWQATIMGYTCLIPTCSHNGRTTNTKTGPKVMNK